MAREVKANDAVLLSFSKKLRDVGWDLDNLVDGYSNFTYPRMRHSRPSHSLATCRSNGVKLSGRVNVLLSELGVAETCEETFSGAFGVFSKPLSYNKNNGDIDGDPPFRSDADRYSSATSPPPWK
ncbi:hypothetical protein ACFX2I_003297 [Malus domestica]